jgi:tRNA threonylcarbamoyladenosine biosynthesis protein TsaE
MQLPPDHAPTQAAFVESAAIELATPAQTRELGRALARVLTAGDLVLLIGPLGAGKTVLAQGIGAGLGVTGPVVSPTFVIARVHRGGRLPMVHVDAYRLGSIAEVDDLDLDADTATSVTVVEWGGGLVEGLAEGWLDVSITPLAGGDGGDEPRAVRLAGQGGRWAEAATDVQLALA